MSLTRLTWTETLLLSRAETSLLWGIVWLLKFEREDMNIPARYLLFLPELRFWIPLDACSNGKIWQMMFGYGNFLCVGSPYFPWFIS